MSTSHSSLTQFLTDQASSNPNVTDDLQSLILEISVACKAIADGVAAGALAGVLGAADNVNVQGEEQKKLDVISNDLFLRATEATGAVAGIASEEEDHIYAIPEEFTRGAYLVAFDPLDGSSNIDVNVAVGSIFSILKAPTPGVDAKPEDFFQPGTEQVAGGYVIYGPSTVLVFTLGNGVNGFTLDPATREFLLTHPDITIPTSTSEFAINASNQRFWEPAVQRYIGECLAGREGPRERDFNMRWIASAVAEVHRILSRGGIFLYPRDSKDPSKAGRLRLLYEANPIAFVIEQAGGKATTGYDRILDVVPTELHQRIGLIFGSAEEVERLEKYHAEPAEELADIPLYGERGLFRTGGN